MNQTTDTAAADTVIEPSSLRGTRTLTGKVVSTKMDKTIKVLIERTVRHETYGKYLRRSTRLLAHDEKNEAKDGDTVTITPCRPLSRHKSWRLLAIVTRAVRQ